jgi:hypothetical protein
MMAKHRHNNSFYERPDADLVYQGLNADFSFYLTARNILHGIGLLLFVVSGALGFTDGWPYFLAGLYLLSWAHIFHTDESNLNYFMHSIDWRDNVKSETFSSIVGGKHSFRDKPTSND